MEIKLQKLTIKNFKGIPVFSFEPGGESKTIYAENGIGKTTVFDAFLWALFGKNSEGKTDFGIRPLDGNNGRIKGLVAVVEVMLSIGDETHTFRKEHHEKIVKKQITGFEAVCTIDEVPKLKGEYEAYIAEIIPEDVFKMLTDLQAFNSLHWSDRRKILMVLAGEIGQPAGFDELLGKLNGRTIKDYEDVLKKRKKAYEKERAEINPRLDEIHKRLEEIGGKELKAAAVLRVAAIAEKAGLVEEKKGLMLTEAGREGYVKAANDLKLELAILENTLKQGDSSKIGKFCREKLSLAQTLSDKRTEVSNAKLTVNRAVDSVTSQEQFLQTKMERRSVLTEGYKELKAIDPDTVCTFIPEGKECPLGHKAKMTADQKKIRLQEFCDTGMALKKEIETFSAVKAKQEEQLSQARIALDNGEKELAKLLTQHDKAVEEIEKRICWCKSGIKPENDDEWKRLDQAVKEAESKVGASMAEGVTLLDKDIEACQVNIDLANVALANKDRITADKARITELEEREKELAQLVADIESELSQIDEYGVAESNLIEAAVNGKFKYTKFKLFDRRLNEGVKDTCEAMFNGTPYRDMSTGEKIFVGVDIRNTLAKHYGIDPVLFVDRSESVTLPIETDAQVIKLCARPNTPKLTVEG